MSPDTAPAPASDDLARQTAPSQRWSWLRPFIPKRLQPYLRGIRKRLEIGKVRGLAEPFRTIYPYTQVHPVRQRNILRLCQQIEREQIPGTCIECGVLDGGTAALIAHATRESARTLHLFDAWEGLPKTTDEDGADAVQWTGQVVGSPRRVAHVLSKLGIEAKRVVIHKGWFQDTFPGADIPVVAFAHVDADFYEATQLCLERWYPRLAPGGYMQFDDYDSFLGCRKAVDEFLARHPELKLEVFGESKAKAHFFRKPL